MLPPPLLLLDFFVVLVMLSVGLRVTGREMLDVLGNRALFARTLLANCFLIPGIGLLLVNMLPLTPDASVGVPLLAAIPGTPISLQFTRMAKTRLAFDDPADREKRARRPENQLSVRPLHWRL